MNETAVTLVGNVCSDITIRETPNGHRVTNLRLAVTPRRMRGGAWEDGETSYYAINCWRSLAEHVYVSVHRGDPVIVQGVMRVRTWQRTDGSTGTSVDVDAQTIGFDLSRGTAVFSRAQRGQASDPAVAPVVTEASPWEGSASLVA